MLSSTARECSRGRWRMGQAIAGCVIVERTAFCRRCAPLSGTHAAPLVTRTRTLHEAPRNCVPPRGLAVRKVKLHNLGTERVHRERRGQLVLRGVGGRDGAARAPVDRVEHPRRIVRRRRRLRPRRRRVRARGAAGTRAGSAAHPSGQARRECRHRSCGASRGRAYGQPRDRGEAPGSARRGRLDS